MKYEVPHTKSASLSHVVFGLVVAALVVVALAPAVADALHSVQTVVHTINCASAAAAQ